MSTKYVISADSHIIEPLDLWTKALARKHPIEKLPRVVKRDDAIKGDYYWSGIEYLKLNLFDPVDSTDSTGQVASFERELAAKVKRCSVDPAVRVELMDYDGISAEIINSTYMLLNMRMADSNVLKDVCTVYNDWLAEHCSHNPKRLLGAAMIDLRDPAWATRELERIAKKGLRTAIVQNAIAPQYPPYRRAVYDPFWAAAQDLDMPITLHAITGTVRDPFTYHTPEELELAPASFIDIFNDIGAIVTQEFIFGRIFDRFPKLRIIFGEYEVSWLPMFMFRLKQVEGAFGRSLNLAPLKCSVVEYMSTRVWHTFVDDPYIDRAYDIPGANQIIWGSDFPHIRNTFPKTHAILDRILAKLPAKVQADISALTAARLFDIELPKEAYAVAAE